MVLVSDVLFVITPHAIFCKCHFPKSTTAPSVGIGDIESLNFSLVVTATICSNMEEILLIQGFGREDTQKSS